MPLMSSVVKYVKELFSISSRKLCLATQVSVGVYLRNVLLFFLVLYN